ncbi:hypothetical protein AGDE_12570 [Angomonas deanei]|uniref:PH domain-containing protein n=1 Tax=Angomonas deanei TaxID=59799 RepID=A0A7G2CDW7_9TRYP|nr:hypothetical protein AGDE_12570 [Angomonas deanei]CAD2217221.1 hypothetical protein, conserved [Angomonas deanei]|eukprot:EPY24023.1 hypothetical protein AGDE_12570 [Angomonas deanei]
MSTAPPRKFPICEGWLDKMPLNRGFFSAKGWKKRYCFVVREGFGYGHKNPREGAASTGVRHLRPADAKVFIPFEKKKRSGSASFLNEVSLLPVYVIRDVSATGHPDLPTKCVDGVCCMMSETTVGGDVPSSSKCMHYYFALTFEEHKKRYMLFLRTSDVSTYINFVTYLPIYVHVGSAQTLIPVAHPLEVEKPIPVDMHVKKYGSPVANVKNNNGKGYYYPSTYEYTEDPDPCMESEKKSIRRQVLSWDAGEAARVKHKIVLAKKLKEKVTAEGAGSILVDPDTVLAEAIKEFDVLGVSVPEEEYDRKGGREEEELEETIREEPDSPREEAVEPAAAPKEVFSDRGNPTEEEE